MIDNYVTIHNIESERKEAVTSSAGSAPAMEEESVVPIAEDRLRLYKR